MPPPAAEVPPPTVRMLWGEAELADAMARAAKSDRRRQDLLDARAAREAWMAERTEERVGWRRTARAR